MAESNPIETVYGTTKCLPEKKSNPGGPCIMKIQNGHTIIQIPTDRIVNHLRDLQRVSIWRSVPKPESSELTEPEFNELETSLGNCEDLTDSSFALLERLIGAGESGDEAGTTDIVVTEDNKTILQKCALISGDEMKELDRLLALGGGKRKSRKSKSKKARKSKKNKSRKTKSRKSKLRKK